MSTIKSLGPDCQTICLDGGFSIPESETVTRSLDEIDVSILRVLAEDGRVSFSDLAARVSISRASAYSRVTRLKEEGIIQGFSARIDPHRVGLGIAALIALKVDFHTWRSVRDELEKMSEIEHYVLTAGEFDLIILVRAPSIESVRDVILERLNSVQGITATTTFFVLDEMLPRRPVLPE